MITEKTVVMFETCDGELFDSKDEASAHEAKLENEPKITAFLKEYNEGRSRTRVESIVRAFVAFSEVVVEE